MEETQQGLKPITSTQLLDAAIRREIGSDNPNRQKPLLTRFPESSLAGCLPVLKLLR